MLCELRALTRGALAEMRTLLLELRPAALVEADLGDLLRQLAESVSGRTGIPVAVSVSGNCGRPARRACRMRSTSLSTASPRRP